MKGKILTLFLVISSAILIVAVLYVISIRNLFLMKNDFERKLNKNEIELVENISLNKKFSEIIGFNKKGIYLMNADRTNIFLLDLKTEKLLNLHFDSFVHETNLTALHEADIDDDKIVISSAAKKRIYIMDANQIEQKKKYRTVEIENGFDHIGISKQNYLIKGRDSLSNAYSYYLNKKTFSKTSDTSEMIQRSRAGIIADDGLFSSSEDKNFTIFAKFHKNEFYVLKNDNWKKNLTIAKKAVSPHIKVTSNGTVTLIGEVFYKNLGASIGNQRLYLESGVKADNESAFRFKFNSVIDVYDLKKSSSNYLRSFYIPSYGGIKEKDFRIKKQFLYALYGNHLIKYKLNNV